MKTTRGMSRLIVAIIAATWITPVGIDAQDDPLSPLGEPSEPLRHDPTWVADAGASTQAYRIFSRVLEEERRIFVSLPESFERTRRPYPVVLVFDGEAILDDVTSAARALARAGHMPEVVLVGVENTDRIRDLSPPGLTVSGNNGQGEADEFAKFLSSELRPKLERDFRGSGPLYMVGHSSGGLFVHWAATSPALIGGGVLGLDAPMHLGDGAAADPLFDAAQSATSGNGYPEALRIVSIEARFGWPDQLWTDLVHAAPEGWQLVREEVEDETHGSMVWPGSYRGLKVLFSDYATIDDRQLPPADRLWAFDQRVEHGEAMPPPSSLLREVVSDRVAALDLVSAGDAVDRLADAYGVTPEVERLRTEIAAAAAEELEGPSLAELRATPIASPDEARPMIGEWRGYTQMEGASTRTPLALSVRVEGDAVAGAFTIGATPPHVFEYLTLAGAEVHIGYMNGMHPRGMLLYEGQLSGDVFEGEFVLRGVVFRMPDGSEIPGMRFRLERAGR